MDNNKKPSWKERLSNWTPTTWDVQNNRRLWPSRVRPDHGRHLHH